MPGIGKQTHCFWNVLEGRAKNWEEWHLKARVKKKLRNYLNGWSLTWTLSVSREVAAIIWNYRWNQQLLVTCVLSCYRTRACLPSCAGQRQRGERHFSSASSGEARSLAFSSSWGGMHFNLGSRSGLCRTWAFTVLHTFSENTKLWVQY